MADKSQNQIWYSRHFTEIDEFSLRRRLSNIYSRGINYPKKLANFAIKNLDSQKNIFENFLIWNV